MYVKCIVYYKRAGDKNNQAGKGVRNIWEEWGEILDVVAKIRLVAMGSCQNLDLFGRQRQMIDLLKDQGKRNKDDPRFWP